MNMENKRETLLQQLSLNLAALNKAAESMLYSRKKCQPIIKNKEHSDADLESCEALTARFARTADLLTQKVLTSIFLLLQETPKTFIDKCNLAEKIGIIESATELMKIRELRNEIAHEYRLADINELFVAISQYSQNLADIIEAVNTYAKNLEATL